MALQLGALRTARLDAGAKPDIADKAAEEVAAYENRPSAVESRLSVLTRMVGANLALTLLLLGAFISAMIQVWAKLGEISGELARLAAH